MIYTDHNNPDLNYELYSFSYYRNICGAGAPRDRLPMAISRYLNECVGLTQASRALTPLPTTLTSLNSCPKVGHRHIELDNKISRFTFVFAVATPPRSGDHPAPVS